MRRRRRVAFIGLGHMGSHMCRHLCTSGHRVSAFDLDRRALARAARSGAQPAGSVAECVADAEILITSLPGPPQVQQVLCGVGGVGSAIAALPCGALIVDMSTSSLEVGRAALAAARARGCDFVDAPVAGQTIRAEAGTLDIYAGGIPQGVRPRAPGAGDDRRPQPDPPPRAQRQRVCGQAAAQPDVVRARRGDRRGAGGRRQGGRRPREAAHRARPLPRQLELHRARRAHGPRPRRLRRGLRDEARHQGPGAGRRPRPRRRGPGRDGRPGGADPSPCAGRLRRQRRRDERDPALRGSRSDAAPHPSPVPT